MSHLRHPDEPVDLSAEEFSPELLSRILKEGDPEAYSIHVVDGDPELLLQLFEMLSKPGFSVSASTRADDALDLVRRNHPKVLICGIHLPDMGGLELLRRVKRVSPGTRVILTAGAADWRDYRDVLNLGGDDLLVKPIADRMLVRAVERVLESSKR